MERLYYCRCTLEAGPDSFSPRHRGISRLFTRAAQFPISTSTFFTHEKRAAEDPAPVLVEKNVPVTQRAMQLCRLYKVPHHLHPICGAGKRTHAHVHECARARTYTARGEFGRAGESIYYNEP